jgi:translation elongation factor EF-G
METVTFIVDEKLQGEINTIVARHEGDVTNLSPSDKATGLAIEAILPTATISEVSDELQPVSAGKAQYISAFCHYHIFSSS